MQAYFNGTIFDGIQLLSQRAVLVEKGRIAGVVAENSIPSDAEIHDLKGNYIAPAFIDLQLYGGNGRLFSHDISIASLQATDAYCLSGGCTQFMITLATNAIDTFLEAIEVARAYQQQGGHGLLGVHLEGPYINPGKRGAHIAQYVKQPTRAEVEQLLKAGEGVFKMMTLAPEQCDPAIIQLLQDNGIIVSAGHSNASYAQGMVAFDAGIPTATHLFNAMSPFQHRAPGLVGAIYDHPSAMSSIVADGIHVDYAAIRISKQIMKDRLFLITDAVTATEGGPYPHVFAGDRYTMPDGTLSGSALTMMKAVKNCVEKVHIELDEALRMASLYPARLAGISNEMGKIEKGYNAEMVVFNAALECVETIH
ncbi:MAG: N-acetylglucosamine-6-phosphate deacetylase [Bacteroidetes bacterium]|nr:N-acetylglucosamine-6-phosphate deacetylase [Bacteroidota bacterium]